VASCFHLKEKAIGTLKALWENLGFGGRRGGRRLTIFESYI